MNVLAQQLIEAGLIQFGWFRQNETVVPLALRLEMLVSYPETLNLLVQTAQAMLVQVGANRVVCSADSLPFGVAFSLQSGIPLVYSRGTDSAPVFDLVGAYDIGHPTLLITNVVGWGQSPDRLIRAVRSVGLEVHTLVTILEVRPTAPPEGITVLPLFRLSDIVRDLTAAGQLAPAHAQAVAEWMKAE